MAYKIKSHDLDKSEEDEPSFLESSFETIKRLPKVSAAGAGSAIAGTVASPFELANLGARGVQALAGQKSLPYEETPVSKLFPTTEQHLKTIHQAFPSTKPRNRVEKFAQDITKDTLSLFTPGKLFKFGKYALTPFRSLGISLGANTVGLGTEKFTGSEEKGELAKSGTMLGLSLFNPTTANAIKSNLYKSADALLPKSATISSSSTMNKFNNLEHTILNNRPRTNLAPSEEFVLKEIDKFKALDQAGQFNVSSLVSQKRSLNEELTKALYTLPDRGTRARARELASSILGISKDAMEQYGLQNPQWWKLQSSADQAASAIYKSNFISRALEKVMKGKPEGFAHLFGVSLPFAGALVSAPSAAAATGAYLGAKYFTRIVKSPELRKHYAKVVGTAVAENVPEKKLKKEVDDFEKKLNKSAGGKFKIKKKNNKTTNQ